jgi:hypothetical protein
MGKQLITISPDGSLVGLDHKRKGLNLRQFGKAKTERATMIEWDEDNQGWFIFWTSPSMPTDRWSSELLFDGYLGVVSNGLGSVILPINGKAIDCREIENALYFDDYEDAVEVEVALIQSMQREGLSIH